MKTFFQLIKRCSTNAELYLRALAQFNVLCPFVQTLRQAYDTFFDVKFISWNEVIPPRALHVVSWYYNIRLTNLDSSKKS